MKIECTHFGQTVTVLLNNTPYEYILKENGIEFSALPVLDTNYRVLKYSSHYAICLPCREDNEKVFIFDQIPDDLDLDLLIEDVNQQMNHHADPIQMKSKAKILIIEAERWAYRQSEKNTAYRLSVKPPISGDKLAQKCAVYIRSQYGYHKDLMETMDHADVDPDFWKALLKYM